MTNLEKWEFYNRDIVSPDAWVRWSFYFMISSALQRRVWIGCDRHPVFPNIYVIFVGDPATGKTFIIKPTNATLRHHTFTPPKRTIEPTEENLKHINEEMLQTANLTYKEMMVNKSDMKRIAEKPLLFPVAADATTFEALTGALARSGRPHYYSTINGDGQPTNKLTPIMCSLCFCLEEISSLFRKHSEEVVKFLLNTYDAGDYRYETKHQGTDIIKRCCVSILGGTTPSFMKQVFSDSLLTDGFASRTFFLYESENRFNKLFIPEITNEQIQAHNDILVHLKKLSELYGEVKLTPDAREFMTLWWETNRGNRTNMNPKLDAYYGRKNLHALKLATIGHFMDSTTMEVNLKECQWAIETLNEAEKSMHLALTFTARNPLATITKQVCRFIAGKKGVTTDELIVEFFEELEDPREDMKMILDHLTMSKKIVLKNVEKGTVYVARE